MNEISPKQVRSLWSQDSPVLCQDGKFGMLVIFPHDNESDCGVQVPGEENHRWISTSNLKSSEGGAIRQNGSKIAPVDQADMAQLLLAMDWMRRGGMSI
jgi:hypothetical protein